MTFKDVIVILPGISGSALAKDGTEVWGTAADTIFRAIATNGDSVRGLALGAADDPNIDDLGDGVEATRLIPDVHMIPGLWKIDGYSGLRTKLQNSLQLEPSRNLFDFPYDWRRDNRVSARKLQRLSHSWLQNWRQASGNGDAKLILVGHSMGGLVARYFLEVLGGWSDTRALITFGTPYRGSLNAVGYLANGYAKSIGPLTMDFSETLRSFTTVYQLLPAFECIDTGDGHLKRVSEAGPLPNIDTARALESLKFYREMKDFQEANAKLDAYRMHGYEIYPIVGVEQPTFQSAQCKAATLSLLSTIQRKDESGDGTVPRLSATPLELTDAHRETYVAEAHASLQNWEPALVQLTGILTGQDINTGLFNFGIEAALSLDLDDVYPANAVEIRARAQNAARVSATITDPTGTEKMSVPLAPSEGGRWTGTVTSLAWGISHYRQGRRRESSHGCYTCDLVHPGTLTAIQPKLRA